MLSYKQEYNVRKQIAERQGFKVVSPKYYAEQRRKGMPAEQAIIKRSNINKFFRNGE
jgi:nucleoside 2-deoxyribosyltransferase